MLDLHLRAWVYDTLAQIFDGVLAPVRDPPVHDGSPPRVAEAIASFRRAAAAASPAEFAVDYVRLFVNAPGGIAAPPYASFYIDERLLGPSCDWVECAYDAQGLAHDPAAGQPADYLAAELEFVHFLVRHEMAARTTGDIAALDAVLSAQADFVSNHLARWVPRFAARVRVSNPHPAFEAAICLLGAVLEEEAPAPSPAGSKPAANAFAR